MRWSWRIGRVAGIDLYVHATFLLLLAYVAHLAYQSRHSWVDAYGAVLLVAAFFGVVVLHELGHCLTARRFGIQTRDITLLPIGGVARLERLPDRPWQELVIALAGPAVNVVIGVALYALLRAPAPGQLLVGLRLVGGDLLVNLFHANALMAVLNLAPAFPMDGGRVLRALLALRQDYARATDQAATVGQALAWACGAIALFKQNWWLLLIAVFVVLGAEAEAGFVRTRAALARVRVGDLMIREFRTLAPEEPLSRAVALALAGFQQDFPVVEGDRVVGVLTRRRLLAGLARGDDRALVREFMLRDFCTARVWESAGEAFQRLQDCECPAMPVLEEDRLVGLLTAEQLGEHLLVRQFRSEPRPGPPGGRDAASVCASGPGAPSSGA